MGGRSLCRDGGIISRRCSSVASTWVHGHYCLGRSDSRMYYRRMPCRTHDWNLVPDEVDTLTLGIGTDSEPRTSLHPADTGLALPSQDLRLIPAKCLLYAYRLTIRSIP